MIRNLLVLSIVFNAIVLPGQNFTWMKGSNTGGQIGLYGTQGVASATNNPGCRHGSATWVDAQGNLWMFGGEGYSNNNTLCWLNDLWKYDISNNMWTWISGANTANQPGVYGTQGVPSALNHPGAREFMLSWTDASGNFWLFGGDGFASTAAFGKLGDLWRYNPTNNQWTWMKGFNTVDQNGVYGTLGLANAANQPGCRSSSGAWFDGAGNLWLFGGRGLPAAGAITGFLNDLWKYSISTNQWTWVNGSNLISQASVYGTLNVGAALNTPGGTEFPSYWANGNDLYLFGGRGFPGSGPLSYLNTFWKYSISLNQWTWIGGSNSIMAVGNYGTQGVSSATNIPGARMSAASWNDGTGNLWLFGGEGNAASPGLGSLNDVFRYTIGTGHWTWIKGANSVDQLGTYGTQTVPAPNNVPGGRYYNTYWPYTNGVCWLQGGLGYSNSNTPDNMEDLWKFVPSCQPENINISPSSTLCAGNTITLNTLANGSNTVTWYNQPAGGTAIATGTQFINTIPSSSLSVSVNTIYAESANCSAYPRTSITLTVFGLPVINISGNTLLCAGDTFSLIATGNANTYTWSTGSNSSSISNTINTTSSFTISGSSNNGCINQNVVTVTVHPQILLSIAGTNTVCSGNTLTLTALGNANTYTWSTGSSSASITLSPIVNQTITLIGEDLNGCSASTSYSLSVLDLPQISIQSKSVMCLGEQAVITASGALTYFWNTGQSGNSISVSPPNTTTYSVTGTAANTCSSNAVFTINVEACLGLEKQNINTVLFSVYPNPSSGPLQIKTGPLNAGRLSIVNALGQIVYSEAVNNELTEVNLSKGIYICVLYSGEAILKTKKVWIE